MQKKVSAAVRAFGRAHKAGLALLGGLAILLYPFAHWMHENEGTWNPWPRVETEKQKRKRLIKEQERQEKKNKKK